MFPCVHLTVKSVDIFFLLLYHPALLVLMSYLRPSYGKQSAGRAERACEEQTGFHTR